jgi:alkaline phosphatase D
VRAPIDRRTFLRRAAATSLATIVAPPFSAAEQVPSAQAPALVMAPGAIPTLPQGVAAGAAGARNAVVWSRCDRPARIFVDYATTQAFTNARTVRGPAALESSDLTARVLLTDLPAGQQIFYRVRFQDLADLRAWSEPTIGQFSTAPWSASRDVTLAWSADTVGQGWGINSAFGGLRLYETMLAAQPDLFLHCGDTIYADAPLPAEIALDDGSVWRNVVTDAKSRVAQTLDDYRGNYLYNLQDAHMRRFNAAVGQVVIWDDHEVRDNWYPTRDLTRDDRYTTKSAALLAARAKQAFFEYNPLPTVDGDPERIYRVASSGPLVDVFTLDLRTHRGPNSTNQQPTLDDDSRIMGQAQVAWFMERLAASRATWKVIVNDMPIGLVVRDAPSFFEAVANGHDGPPLGRELEFAQILKFIRDRRIRNVVWVTGDVHYCAAHRYDPARARFTDFDPFWEFVAGPLHAGTFGPSELDATFGPEVKFTGIPPGMKPNRPPSEGLQFFGTLRIDARTRRLRAALHNLAGQTIYQVELEAVR